MGEKQQANSNQSTHIGASPTFDELREGYLRHRRFVSTQQMIMAIGFLVTIQYWFAHLCMFDAHRPNRVDLVAGYSMGALLPAIGSVAAGKAT